MGTFKALKGQDSGYSNGHNPTYIGSVIKHLPGVPIVLDHFHVVKLMNDRLIEVRRKLYHELHATMDKKVLKGSRWILLKKTGNLNPDRQEHKRKELTIKSKHSKGRRMATETKSSLNSE